MRVEEVMTCAVWTCRPEDPLSRAAALMWDHDVGAVPVVGTILGAEQHLVGIVTDRDVCMAAYFTGQPIASVPVSHAMSKAVYAVDPRASLAAAEQLMREKQVRRLPVVDGYRLVGMITLGDLARATRADELTAGEVTETLAAVTERGPRSLPY